MKRQLAVGFTVAMALAGPQAGTAALPVARAAVVADSASADALAACGSFFSQPGHDPAGLWGRLSRPGGPVVQVKFLPVNENGAGTGTGRLDNDGSRIFWDHTRDVVKDGITASPCEVLYHELQHADDNANKDLNDSQLNETCNGVQNAEWRAVGAQNALRRALHLPERPSYNGDKFGISPSFEQCKKNQFPNTPPVECFSSFRALTRSHPPCEKPSPTNSVFGDPHIATSDGLFYDLQLVGEFTAFTANADGAPHVQVRTSPVAGSTVASMVTAVAIGDRDRRIMFAANDSTTITTVSGTTKQEVTLDEGARRDLGDDASLSADGARKGFTGKAYTVQWTDGSELRVDSTNHWGLRVSFDPSEDVTAAMPRGLLGNFNGDAADDLGRPDGRTVPANSPAAVIRSDFGDAWRINQADSLFAYGSGESTATFTDRAFPHAEPQFPSAATDQARQICRDAGIIAAELLAACIFDVSVTGNPALADTAAAVAREVVVTAAAGSPPPQRNPVSSGEGPLRDGSRVADAITDPLQSKRYDLDLGDATTFYVADWRGTTDRCDQTFRVNFVGVSVDNAPCGGQNMTFSIDETEQPHQLEIVSSEGGVGSYSFSLITLKPRDLSAVPGATVSGMLDVRGRRDRYVLPAGLKQLAVNSPMNCNGDNIDFDVAIYDFTENKGFVAARPLCTGRRGPWELPDPTHQYVAVISNSDLHTGPYSFTIE